MADSQLPCFVGVTRQSNSIEPRCHSTDAAKACITDVHKDVVRRRCSQRHGTWSEYNKTRRTSLVKRWLRYDSHVSRWSDFCKWTRLMLVSESPESWLRLYLTPLLCCVRVLSDVLLCPLASLVSCFWEYKVIMNKRTDSLVESTMLICRFASAICQRYPCSYDVSYRGVTT